MAIESEVKRQRITNEIERWCNYTKVTSQLRPGDISSLVKTILEEFYNDKFCCGHLGHLGDGVLLTFESCENGEKGEVSGVYCKDCAEEYKRDLGAWEIKNE